MDKIVLVKTSHDFLEECVKEIDHSEALEFLEDERDMLDDLLNDLKDYIDYNCTFKKNKMCILQTLCMMRCLRDLIEHEDLIDLNHQLGFIEDIISGLKEELITH